MSTMQWESKSNITWNGIESFTVCKGSHNHNQALNVHINSLSITSSSPSIPWGGGRGTVSRRKGEDITTRTSLWWHHSGDIKAGTLCHHNCDITTGTHGCQITSRLGHCHQDCDITTGTSQLWHCHQDRDITTGTSRLWHCHQDRDITTGTSRLWHCHQDCDITTGTSRLWH